MAGVGEAYKRAAYSVQGDVGLIRTLGAVADSQLEPLLKCITSMEREVSFRYVRALWLSSSSDRWMPYAAVYAVYLRVRMRVVMQCALLHVMTFTKPVVLDS